MTMNDLARTTVAEVKAAMGSMAAYSAELASDGMSVEVRLFLPDASAGTHLRSAFEVIDRLNDAGFWTADTETYWTANVADRLADGKPVWVGRA
jgi:hypothetical protein